MFPSVPMHIMSLVSVWFRLTYCLLWLIFTMSVLIISLNEQMRNSSKQIKAQKNSG